MVFLDVDGGVTPDFMDCGEEKFGCEAADTGEQKCFPNNMLCDGDAQCADGSDEQGACSMYTQTTLCQ